MDKREEVLVVPARVVTKWADRFHDAAWVCTQSNVGEMEEFGGEMVEEAFFMDREAAEKDPSFIQLIPYCVLVTPVDQTGEVVAFGYRRTKKCGEARLHDKWAFGVGGHINPVDGGSNDSYENALRRELKEEVGLDFASSDGMHSFAPHLGFIYDPSNEVGKVHLGFVHKVWVGSTDKLTFNDPSMADGQWFTRASLADGPPNAGTFEGWSAVVVSRFADKLFADKW